MSKREKSAVYFLTHLIPWSQNVTYWDDWIGFCSRWCHLNVCRWNVFLDLCVCTVNVVLSLSLCSILKTRSCLFSETAAERKRREEESGSETLKVLLAFCDVCAETSQCSLKARYPSDYELAEDWTEYKYIFSCFGADVGHFLSPHTNVFCVFWSFLDSIVPYLVLPTLKGVFLPSGQQQVSNWPRLCMIYWCKDI